jgi:lysophospholipase
MGIPLRGELTSPSTSAPAQPTMDQNLENIQGLLSHFVRLSRPPSKTPTIVISRDTLDETTQDAAAPWSWTAAEAASTEAALFPFLIHLSAARDDVDSMKFSIAAASNITPGSEGGIINCLEAGSGRSPLHVAALNGSAKCVRVLLQSGALVHLRDALGHTALYYVSRFFWVFHDISDVREIHPGSSARSRRDR